MSMPMHVPVPVPVELDLDLDLIGAILMHYLILYITALSRLVQGLWGGSVSVAVAVAVTQ